MMREQVTPLVVRRGVPEDREFVLAVAARLAELGPPAWLPPEQIVAREARTLRDNFEQAAPGAALLVAAGADGSRLGFVFLETKEDYFSGESHGHIGMLAVAPAAEGRGVGRLLMDAAERWAQDRGFGKLTLNVFEDNRRARAVYEHLDYRAETVRYVKLLGKSRQAAGVVEDA
jgi:ribosomal protein S18 acetylase RimI-like enzyme